MSEYYKDVKEALRNKSFLRDDIYASIIIEKIIKESLEANLILLDGFPNNEYDWKYFFNKIGEYGIKVSGAIYMQAEKEICIERLNFRGIRNGEQVRIKGKKLLDFYEERYSSYIFKEACQKKWIKDKGIQIKILDTSTNILVEEEREKVYFKFKKIIDILINNI